MTVVIQQCDKCRMPVRQCVGGCGRWLHAQQVRLIDESGPRCEVCALPRLLELILDPEISLHAARAQVAAVSSQECKQNMNGPAGEEFTRFRRDMLRQEFYGLVTAVIKTASQPRATENPAAPVPQIRSLDFLLKVCEIDSTIEVAEQLRRMNELTTRAQNSGNILDPNNVDAAGLAMRRMMEIATGQRDPEKEALANLPQAPAMIDFVCCRCGNPGQVQTSSSPQLIISRILLKHSQTNPRCAADEKDIVIRTPEMTESDWNQELEKASQNKRIPPNGGANPGGHVV